MTDKKEGYPENFNPDDNHIFPEYIFGLPLNEKDATIIMIPAPWDVTVSYGKGTASGPSLIRKASLQLDLYDPLLGEPWKTGLFMRPESDQHIEKNKAFSLKVQQYRNLKNTGRDKHYIHAIDAGCRKFLDDLREQCKAVQDHGQIVAIIGGEHTTALPLLEALDEKGKKFGILQIDAHADLRNTYEGLTYSHATVMHHALQLKCISQITAAGLRDFSSGEKAVMDEHKQRYTPFFAEEIFQKKSEGVNFAGIASAITDTLPDNVYISFDIDGLDPWLCPGTGTPVPGGLSFQEAVYLISEVVRSGRRIIGFDLTETAPSRGEWDGNVAARILYKLCGLTAASNK